MTIEQDIQILAGASAEALSAAAGGSPAPILGDVTILRDAIANGSNEWWDAVASPMRIARLLTHLESQESALKRACELLCKAAAECAGDELTLPTLKQINAFLKDQS